MEEAQNTASADESNNSNSNGVSITPDASSDTESMQTQSNKAGEQSEQSEQNKTVKSTKRVSDLAKEAYAKRQAREARTKAKETSTEEKKESFNPELQKQLQELYIKDPESLLKLVGKESLHEIALDLDRKKNPLDYPDDTIQTVKRLEEQLQKEISERQKREAEQLNVQTQRAEENRVKLLSDLAKNKDEEGRALYPVLSSLTQEHLDFLEIDNERGIGNILNESIIKAWDKDGRPDLTSEQWDSLVNDTVKSLDRKIGQKLAAMRKLAGVHESDDPDDQTPSHIKRAMKQINGNEVTHESIMMSQGSTRSNKTNSWKAPRQGDVTIEEIERQVKKMIAS